jgi:hypothetical protein
VVWKSLPAFANDVTCEHYSAHGAISSSDHKPVSCGFRIRTHSDTIGTNPLSAIVHSSHLSHRTSSLSFLQLSGESLLAADISGFSDPYILFFSEPPGLLVESESYTESNVIKGSLRAVTSVLRADKTSNMSLTAPRSRVKNQTLNPVSFIFIFVNV